MAPGNQKMKKKKILQLAIKEKSINFMGVIFLWFYVAKRTNKKVMTIAAKKLGIKFYD